MSELARKLIAENVAKRERGEDASFLDLGNCGLRELPEELGQCTWVEELVLSSEWRWQKSQNQGEANRLHHLNGVERLKRLNKLVVGGEYSNKWSLQDLSPLSGLQNLQSLDCGSTQVQDLSPLSGLQNLRLLDCGSTQVQDLSPLSGLQNLQLLDCSYTQVQDLRPLSGLQNLQTLDCSGTQVQDLRPLSGLQNLQTLGCRKTQIQDLSPLSTLQNLESLDCGETQVKDLSPLAILQNLESLDCGETQVQDLSPLSGLQKLQSLSCFETQVQNLSPLAKLQSLQSLYCDNTQVYDLSPLSDLQHLQTLFCFATQVQDLSPLSGLQKLQELICSDTQVRDLNPLSTLQNLESLDCAYTQVQDLSPLSMLQNLQSLDCENTQVQDLSPLSGLQNLQSLDCGSTQVQDLSPLANLHHLTKLDVSNNPISDLTPILPLIKEGVAVTLDMIRFEGINLHNNPLIIPPIEFAQAGNEAILEYFDQLGDKREPLNELKVIFLGEGAAGKTSLIKRLHGERFDPKEGQTHGIRIRRKAFEVEAGESVLAHIWDFGGQEVMHATHQFFLSRRCVYVLVLNSRTDDKAEYWLKHAQSFGGDSPVLVVLNKMDENPGYDVNRRQLREKYPQIVDFFKLSCKESTGLDAFEAALLQEIARSDTRRTPFPKAWAELKQRFDAMEEDYIETEVYKKVCEEQGVGKAFSQDVLLQFLHDLGLVINFQHLKHLGTQILNPLWLTNGVYRIINSPIVAGNEGLMREEELDGIINDPRYKPAAKRERAFHYPAAKLGYVVRVMEVFELCFQLDTRTYVVPQLLPVEEQAFQMEGQVLRFTLRFLDFLPDSIFPRLMVKLNPYIKGSLRWRTGMVLHKPTVFDAQARIRADREDREIRIDVCGQDPRRLLSFIRETVKEIAADFAKLEYEEMVPVPETERFFLYKDLISMEKAKEKELFVPELKKRISIAHLLDGIEEASMRGAAAQIPVKAFLCYAPQDVEYREQALTALALLVRLGKLHLWAEHDIMAGAERQKEIARELESADIVLCLLSADFIHSDFCYSEVLGKALAAHDRGKQWVVPIRLRPCLWEALPLNKLQATPTSEWITTHSNRDTAWLEVARHLSPLLDKVKAEKATTYYEI